MSSGHNGEGDRTPWNGHAAFYPPPPSSTVSARFALPSPLPHLSYTHLHPSTASTVNGYSTHWFLYPTSLHIKPLRSLFPHPPLLPSRPSHHLIRSNHQLVVGPSKSFILETHQKGSLLNVVHIKLLLVIRQRCQAMNTVKIATPSWAT